MRFSIIIPVYNSAAFLRTCIDSIVSQNFDDYELILIDDGSTDSSGEICREYQKRYPMIRLVEQANAGPSAARNRGMELARGDYITFVDSDDWVVPAYFETLNAALAENPDMVIFGRSCLAGDQMQTLAFPAGMCGSAEEIVAFIETHYTEGDMASCTNKAYSRRILEDGSLRFPVGTVVEEDLQFVLGALDRSERMISLEEGIYFYNRRIGSVTTRFNPVKFDCKLQAYHQELAYARKWNSPRLEQIFHDNYLTYISACVNNLMYADCGMTRAEKLAEIKRFYHAGETTDCLAGCRALSLRSKVMYWLIRLKLYRLSYWIHCITFHIKGR